MSVDPLEDLPITPHQRRLRTRVASMLTMVLVTYLMVAYFALPLGWRVVEKRHPALDRLQRVAQTANKIPGDPLNLAFVADERTLTSWMIKAGWHAADAITFRSSLRIADDTVLRRPDESAPVSSLYVWGKKQDLAFEFPVGHDPRQRHHVRFWRSDQLDQGGRPVWLGAATYDIKVGFSHTTLEITHHISPDVDAERDKVIADLQRVEAILGIDWINGFQRVLKGRNGGGDPYETDGRLPIAPLKPIDTPIKRDGG